MLTIDIRKPAAWYIFHGIGGSSIFGGKEFNGSSSERGASAVHVLPYQEARGKQYQCAGVLSLAQLARSHILLLAEKIPRSSRPFGEGISSSGDWPAGFTTSE